MNIVYSPMGIVEAEHPEQGTTDMVNAGYQDILLDTTMCCPSYELEYQDRLKEKSKKKALVSERPTELYHRMKPFADQCARRKLYMTVGRAPYLTRDTKQKDLKEILIQLTEESLKLCGKAGCQYIIIRPWSAGVESGEEWNVNREYYLHFASLAREYNVKILLENQCRDVSGHLVRGTCSDAVEAAEWVDKLNEAVGEECFGFCMDTGVSNICGQNMYDFILTLGNRLKAVILRDCDGKTENALLPFTSVSCGQSQTDWLSILRGLREIEYDGQLILNIMDTVSSFSVLLRPGVLSLAKSVAEFFKWQVEMEKLLKKHTAIVLFGAGNMCRNYMKCYGEKYPPLYTCDNNRKLWGTAFCGLEVKSPESLKSLPKDCAVFICNIYYREIEKQLREMGIQNPIEFFNDEYMPAYYFDRLEREER